MTCASSASQPRSCASASNSTVTWHARLSPASARIRLMDGQQIVSRPARRVSQRRPSANPAVSLSNSSRKRPMKDSAKAFTSLPGAM